MNITAQLLLLKKAAEITGLTISWNEETRVYADGLTAKLITISYPLYDEKWDSVIETFNEVKDAEAYLRLLITKHQAA